jgi:DNA-binding response OmpR family regulator
MMHPHQNTGEHGCREEHRGRQVNLLLVGSNDAFKSDVLARVLDGDHFQVIARSSALLDALACLESGAVDVVLLSNEYREEELTLFSRDARRHEFSGLILCIQDTPRALAKFTSDEIKTIRAGDFVIDVSNHQCWCRGCEVGCSPFEFRLLRFMCEHPGELLTRKALLEVLWNNPAASPHSLTVLIRAVRAKIETTETPRYIVTQRSLGYRFIPAPELKANLLNPASHAPGG